MKNKQHTILFVFGAGTSREAGGPLMSDFLDRAKNLYSTGKISQNIQNDFSTVFQAINALQLIHSRAQLDLYNIESIFTAFESSLFLKNDPAIFNPELIISLKRLITVTIESSIKFGQLGYSMTPPSIYSNFVEHMKDLQKSGYRIVILSFNYDIALDFALLSAGFKINYCLSDQYSEAEAITYLKLHGSLHWRECKVCNQILAINLGEIFLNSHQILTRKTLSSAINPNLNHILNSSINSGYISIGLEKILIPHLPCNGEIENVGFLIPPTWNKQGHYEAIRRVWVSAAEEIRNASSIIVCGYSLPQTDQYFQSLYSSGSMNSSPLERFLVYNPDETGDVENRFRDMLGTGAIRRFAYIGGNRGKFSAFIADIGRVFQNKTKEFIVV